MHRARRSRGAMGVEITPLIDVVFLLLTFFVFALILTTRVSAVDVTLPTGGEGADAGGEGSPVVVVLLEDGGVELDGKRVGVVSEAGFGEALSIVMSAVDAGRLEREGVAVAIDEGGARGDVLALMEALAEAGVEDASFWREPPGDDAGGGG